MNVSVKTAMPIVWPGMLNKKPTVENSQTTQP
jgi:hypothetical protein